MNNLYKPLKPYLYLEDEEYEEKRKELYSGEEMTFSIINEVISNYKLEDGCVLKDFIICCRGSYEDFDKEMYLSVIYKKPLSSNKKKQVIRNNNIRRKEYKKKLEEFKVRYKEWKEWESKKSERKKEYRKQTYIKLKKEFEDGQ
jgi:hypothetical protein